MRIARLASILLLCCAGTLWAQDSQAPKSALERAKAELRALNQQEKGAVQAVTQKIQSIGKELHELESQLQAQLKAARVKAREDQKSLQEEKLSLLDKFRKQRRALLDELHPASKAERDQLEAEMDALGPKLAAELKKIDEAEKAEFKSLDAQMNGIAEKYEHRRAAAEESSAAKRAELKQRIDATIRQ